MRKNKIIYSLSSRGLYSELFNLCLAVVYSREKQMSFQLNTWLWNARIKKGWQDYFEPTLDCYNNPFSAQDKVYTKETPWIGKLYYKPKEFLSFYYRLILNHIYQLFHPNHLLTKDIFECMRSNEFISETLGDSAFNTLSSSFKQIYKIDQTTQEKLNQRIKKFNLPPKYIGVHIRRGDKISSKEMQDIHLDKYLRAIINYKDISTNVYIATDDMSIIKEINTRLNPCGFSIFFNHQNQSTGFYEDNFNKSTKLTRQEETLNVLLDMEILIHSTFFIGTYTSNLSRVVPFFLGLDKCISLDNDWNIINSMNGM